MFFSQVKYKEDLTWLKGIGCYAYDTPDFTLAEKNKTLYSKVYIFKENWPHPFDTYLYPQRELALRKSSFTFPSVSWLLDLTV